MGLSFPVRSFALEGVEEGEVRAMLRAARRYADEADLKAKERDSAFLGRIAEEQYRAGDAEGARETVRAATQTPRGDYPCPFSDVLVDVARVQWETGNVAESSATMAAVLDMGRRADKKARAECLKSLVMLKAELGDTEEALAIAADVPGVRNSDVYPELALLLGRRGSWERATAVADRANPLYGDSGFYGAMVEPVA